MNGVVGKPTNNGRTAEETFARRFYTQQAMSTWSSIMIDSGTLADAPMSLLHLAERLGFPLSVLPPLVTNMEVDGSILTAACYWDSQCDHFPMHLRSSSSEAFLKYYINKHLDTHRENRDSARIVNACVMCRFWESAEFKNIQEERALLPYRKKHPKIEIKTLPTISAKPISKCKVPITYITTEVPDMYTNNELVWQRNRRHFSTPNSDYNNWTARRLRTAIERRLIYFRNYDVIQDVNAVDGQLIKFIVTHIEPEIQVYKSFLIASGERVDSILWSSEARSNVLVVCPKRDEVVFEYMQNHKARLSQTNEVLCRWNFTKDEAILHPASVTAFIAVEYVSVLHSYWLENKDAGHFQMMREADQSQAKTDTAYFAVCDFYKPHFLRKTHEMGGLAEMWSDVFFDMHVPFPADPDKRDLADHIVPINRLSGKFCKGSFSKLAGSTVCDPATNKDRSMLVLRCPFKV
jgi:hypothetical protein